MDGKFPVNNIYAGSTLSVLMMFHRYHNFNPTYHNYMLYRQTHNVYCSKTIAFMLDLTAGLIIFYIELVSLTIAIQNLHWNNSLSVKCDMPRTSLHVIQSNINSTQCINNLQVKPLSQSLTNKFSSPSVYIQNRDCNIEIISIVDRFNIFC